MMLKKYFMEHRRLWLGLCSLFFLVTGWELVLTYVVPVNPFFFTKPSLIAAAFKEQVQGAKLWHDLAVSSQAFIWGFSFAVIVGIPVGLVMGWRRRVEYSLDPFLTALYASPLVALAPLFIIVFGVGGAVASGVLLTMPSSSAKAIPDMRHVARMVAFIKRINKLPLRKAAGVVAQAAEERCRLPLT